jgi:transposase-like protein
MKKTALRVHRIFSEDLRKEIVKQIELGQLSVTNASREYDVRVPTIYTWLNKYSRNLKKGTRLVMEKDSVEKTILDLRNRILELEAALGRKSLESDLYKTMVELASKEYKTDLKKKHPATSRKKNDDKVLHIHLL